MRVKFGFTLAEVLITLGIIGVVAAVTMPVLITKHQQQVTVQRLKKVYSVLSQALVRSEVDNGPMSDWDFPQERTYANALEFFNKYFKPYMQAKECTDNKCKLSKALRHVNYIMPDGTIIVIDPDTIPLIYIPIDINGMAPPNADGRDRFYMDITPEKRVFMLGNNDVSYTREDYKNGIVINGGKDTACCAKTCATPQYAKYTCGALIQADGWQIKDDYPW